MAWSKKEIRRKKYLPFPGHNDLGSRKYHSEKLPNPNVIRIEVLSPSAKSHYLNGGLYAITNRFQQALMENMMYPGSIEPFYGFFDPETQGVAFGISAQWDQNRKHGFGEMISTVKSISNGISKVPFGNTIGKVGSGVADAVGGFADFAEKMANRAGFDTNSTGACTLKDFKGSSFNFDKTIVCRWYMPEQENMARLSISRLLMLTFVRSVNRENKDIVGELTKAVSEMTESPEWKDTMSAVSDFGNEVKDYWNTNVIEPVKQKVRDAANADTTASLGGEVLKRGAQGIMVGDYLVDQAVSAVKNLAPDKDTMDLATDVIRMAANEGIDFMLKVNTFFGGNLTVNPFPVRLTMGHILDIEPLVIERVDFESSKEQFITEDGTHIPLFITARIKFGMWMTPDPKKGFIRWMGDDVFNSGRFLSNAKAGGNSGTTNSRSGKKKGGK